jgi:hypothetical protein
MTEERMMVFQAVLDGKLGVEHMTLEELNEIQNNLFEVIADKTSQFDTSGLTQ